MDSVAKSLPALMRADKIRSKAKKAGYAPKSYETAYEDTEEKLKALSKASYDKAENNRKIGELLFSVINLAAMVDVNPEESLYRACDDFTENFRKLEENSSK